jgi:hypothetical protein
LDYIKSILGIGKIIPSRNKPEATFEVTIQSEIRVIISIFYEYNLNTTKHLNFISFSRAFLLYMENNSPESRNKIKTVIDSIRGDMNLSRTDFNFPQYHEINITPN